MVEEEILQQLFPGIDHENRKFYLKDFIKRYPYFAPAHFFLYKETRDTLDAAKAAMYLPNSFLLTARVNGQFPNSGTTLIETSSRDNISPDSVTGVKPEVDIEQPQTLISEDTGEIIPDLKENKEDTLMFEPLHTTDYFASQGIKLSEVVKSDDKLGKQLKSFTDWLKTMKKIPAATQNSVAIDISVQTIAEKSNLEEDVLTESMAEVYISQGKIQKAREIYNKLSLLNPSKSAYFAAKIDQLKEN